MTNTYIPGVKTNKKQEYLILPNKEGQGELRKFGSEHTADFAHSTS